MKDVGIEELEQRIETEVKSIKDKRILILIYLYSHKLNARHKERERH